MSRIRIHCLPLLLAASLAHGATFSITPDHGVAGRSVDLRVDARDMQNAGRYELILRFDPHVIEVRSVQPGPTLSGELMDHTVTAPGELWIGGAISAPQVEHVPLVTVKATVIGSAGSESALSLTASRVWSIAGGAQLPLHARDLQFEVRRAFLPFGLTPLQVIGTVLAITAFATWRILRRTRRAPRPDWETAPPVAPPEAAPAPPAQAPPVAVPPVAVADPIDGPPPAI